MKIILAAELERKNAEVEARNFRENVDKLKEKVEDIKREVSVRPKNRTEGGRSAIE